MNVLSCAPFTKDKNTGKIGVRPPTPIEAEACRPRFLEQIYCADPKMIVLLGKSAKTYLKLPKDLEHVKILELYHPAYLLRKGGLSSLEYDKTLLYLNEAIEELLYGKEISIQA